MWKRLADNYKIIGGVILLTIALVGVATGWAQNIDDRYAKADTVLELIQSLEQTNARLEYKITDDQADAVQRRIWKIEDRYEDRDMPDTVVEELRELAEELEDLEEALDDLESD